MVEIITYSLKHNQTNSDQYYEDVAVFTDKVLESVRRTSGSLISQFMSTVEDRKLEKLRSEPEYIFEFLTLGMLFQLYSAEASQLRAPSQKILSWLYTLRTKYTALKPAADFLRGIFSGLWINTATQAHTAPYSIDCVAELLRWMQATGDFSEAVERLKLWESFIKGLSEMEQANCLAAAVDLAVWFSRESEKVLGKYTPNVETFLKEKHPGYQWREDKLFCGRKRAEYHMNMVGTEILNRAFREEFLSADPKIVLLPPCMKARQDGTCQAVSTAFGDQCAHCTPSCRVHQITLLGEKLGFKVQIIPHELSVFSSGKIKAPREQALGIVGVSCPVTNVTGGWDTKNLGIPAQGVLLDYCGCRWHWHDKGIPTDVNITQLLKVVAPDHS